VQFNSRLAFCLFVGTVKFDTTVYSDPLVYE